MTGSAASAKKRIQLFALLALLGLAAVVPAGLREYVKVLVGSDLLELSGALGHPTCSPLGIVLHHTATEDWIAGHRVDVALLDLLHKQRGFGTIWRGRIYHLGYHYLILSDGTIQAGRPEQCEGAHAGTTAANRSYLGIALVGYFDSSVPDARPPTDAQLESAQHLIRALMQRYGFGLSKVLGHSEIREGTQCPGDLWPIKRWRAQATFSAVEK